MNIWLKSLLIGAAAAAVAFFINKNSRHVNRKLVTVDLIVEITPDENISSREFADAMVRLPSIIKHRCEAAGYSANIKTLNQDKELQISIGHVEDVTLATTLATGHSKLEFRELYTLPELFSSFLSMTEAVKKFFPPGPDSNKYNKLDITSLLAFSIDQNGRPLDGATIGRVMKKDTSLLSQIFKDTGVLRSFPQDVRFAYGPIGVHGKAKTEQPLVYLYAIKTKMQESALQNRHIMQARSTEGYSGQPELVLQFNNTGSRIWEKMTMENKGRYLAIIIDKNVIFAPLVLDAITGGSASISGGFTPEEVETLALQLNAGYIPVELLVLQRHITPEKPSSNGKNLLIPLIVFLVAAGVSFTMFYSLKRK